jgi:hypothetical protein
VAPHRTWPASSRSSAAEQDVSVREVRTAAYQVRSHHGEWEATLYLAQPVRHTNGIWVVTRVGDPLS